MFLCYTEFHLFFFFFCYQGLVVPVLRNVGGMNYAEIEKGINELGLKVCVCVRVHSLEKEREREN